LPLFNVMKERFRIRFFFQKQSDVPNDLDCYFSRKNVVENLRPGRLALKDIIRLYQNIKRSDLFITSFVRSLYSFTGIVFSRILRKRVIVWEEWMTIRKNRLRYRLRDFLAVKTFRWVDAFFVMGKRQRETLISLGYDAERIFEANEYPGYRYSEVSPEPVELPFREDVKMVLFLGRLIECKGVDYLIRAFRLLEENSDNAALLVVGDGPEKEKLSNLAASLGLRNIYFSGAIRRPGQKSFLFKRSSVAVVPSIITEDKSDPGPLVTLEVLSAGLPLILSDAVGNSYLVRDGINGYVVPQRDEFQLFEKLKCLLEKDVISREQVLADFNQIPDHEYQAQQVEKAIRCALRAAA
jgi:glycosyltransferase involved in cell wall biosynthesis